MTYLSRILLNRRHPLVRRDLADCRELHRTVLAAFPTATAATGAREQFGLLYRLETTSQGALPRVLVQSQAHPNWLLLKPGYLLDTEGNPENPACKSIDAMTEALGVGSILRFRLRANPTKRLSTPIVPDGKRAIGKRVELHGEEAQLDWLHRKAEQCGFRVPAIAGHAAVANVRVIPEPKVAGNQRLRAAAAAGRLTFGSVLFDGILQISDLPKFQDALEHGIGPGKAYGFGLLSIAGVGR